MATHDYVLDNATGANFRSDLNNALAAIVSNNSSSSEPSTKYAYQWWADTNDGVLKIRNSSNDGWVTLLQLDGTLTLEDGSASAPALGFRDDLNTGIFSSAADNVDITTGGTTRVNISSTGINVTGTVTDDGAVHDGNVDLNGNIDVSGTSTLNNDVSFVGASGTILFDKSDNQIEFPDNMEISMGTGGDLQITHNGTDNIFKSTNGEIQLNNGTENMARFVPNSLVALYFDDSKKLETQSSGVEITGNVIATGNLAVNDNGNINVGNSGDLQLFHNGTNSFIDSDTGNLVISSVADLRFNSTDYKFMNAADSETLARFTENGAVKLYFDNSLKFETTTDGVKIDGGLLEIAHTSCHIDFMETSTTNHRLRNGSGNFQIQKISDDKSTTTTQFLVDGGTGAVELYHNGTKKAETVSGGFTVSGTCTATAFSGDGSGLTGVGGSDLVNDTSPQLGGDLDTNSFEIFMDASHAVKFNTNSGQIYHDGSQFYIGSADLRIVNYAVNETMAKFISNGAVALYHDDSQKFFTNSAGITVESTGNTPKVEFRGASNLDMGKIHVDQFATNFSAMSFFTMSSGSQNERMRLLDNGNLCVMADPTVATANLQSPGQGNGNTAIGVALQEAGRVIANSAGSFSSFGRNDSGTVVSFTRQGGDQGAISVAVGSVSYGSGSDYRLKENIASLTGAITRIKQLLPKRFNFIEDTTNTLRDGFLAHEVSSIVPEAITGTKDAVDSDNKPIYQQIDQAKLVPLLVAAVQELITKVETLEAA